MTAGAATEILERLVAFDTTSCNSNLPIIEYISDYLTEHGIASERLLDATGEKANLFATIGPQNAAGVGLSGHTDVVPVTGQDWQTDPFTLTAKNGKLYGRGACDMKGFLACVMAAVPEFQRRSLAVPLHILFSYDEEVGCTGVRPMIDAFDKQCPRPRMVIVGEPTNMTIVDAHKGPVRWSVTITGRPAHSSLAHLGVNTIAAAGELLAELSEVENELKLAPRDSRFSPPYTTLQVTEIKGGAASNIVPAETWFGWEIRAIPGVEPDAIEERVRRKADTVEARMRAAAPEAGINIERTNEVPAFAADPDSEIMSLGLRLAEQNETFAVSYATEASLFNRAGSPAIVCGPGDIAQAHTPNEWIARDELDKCMAFLCRLADWAQSG